MENNYEFMVLEKKERDTRGSNHNNFIESKITKEELEKNLLGFCNSFSSIVDKVDSQTDEYEIAEIIVKLQVGAKGKIGFFGIGSELSGQTGLDVKFKKK